MNIYTIFALKRDKLLGRETNSPQITAIPELLDLRREFLRFVRVL
jgi:hypothetical protein